ncbi:mammaglobin-A [Acomys russatus]|uniref:mammaglobin-A n=1 Tax=Acomys russatus TaxID=60746 RepID=UPI0021E26BDF|nr:mammaglobin-A [Acomys russatus]
MKLVVVFMLAAIPICCYANSSGCENLDKIIEMTIDPDVSQEELLEVLDPYVHTPVGKNAVKKFKQCFLDQSRETLEDVKHMMDVIYASEECQTS